MNNLFIVVQVLQQQTMSGYSIANTYNNCTESYGQMQKYYIDALRQSEFSYFCEKYEDECTEQNVLIKC
jgi:Tfp pilus assembly protein PilX